MTKKCARYLTHGQDRIRRRQSTLDRMAIRRMIDNGMQTVTGRLAGRRSRSNPRRRRPSSSCVKPCSSRKRSEYTLRRRGAVAYALSNQVGPRAEYRVDGILEGGHVSGRFRWLSVANIPSNRLPNRRSIFLTVSRQATDFAAAHGSDHQHGRASRTLPHDGSATVAMCPPAFHRSKKIEDYRWQSFMTAMLGKSRTSLRGLICHRRSSSRRP